MRVELICADAFDPEHGLVAHGPVDHVVADPAHGDEAHRRHRITLEGAGGVRARQRALTDPGGRVADPLSGSGTTWVASVRLGRAACGRERVEPRERPRLRAEQLELEDA